MRWVTTSGFVCLCQCCLFRLVDRTLGCVFLSIAKKERVPQSVPRYETMLGFVLFFGFLLSVRYSLEGRPKTSGEEEEAPHYPGPSPTLLQTRTATFPETPLLPRRSCVVRRIDPDSHTANTVNCLPAPITGAVLVLVCFVCVFVDVTHGAYNHHLDQAPEAIVVASLLPVPFGRDGNFESRGSVFCVRSHMV